MHISNNGSTNRNPYTNAERYTPEICILILMLN